MNQKARQQVDKIRENVIRHESRERHKELVLGLCKICHEENLDDECPLLEYMMEDLDKAMSGLTVAENIDRMMINRLKININTN